LQFADCSPKKFADLWFNQKKFADFKFLDSHITEICGFAIANCAQEFSDKKNIYMPIFANCPLLTTILAANLPPVSTTPVAYCPWYQQH
jgi:hypothetical protein